MVYKMIQVGTGGFGKAWVERFLPPNVQDGLIEVVAAVDLSTEALKNAQNALGLRPERLEIVCEIGSEPAVDQHVDRPYSSRSEGAVYTPASFRGA